MSNKNLIIALILPYDKCDNENEKMKKWKNNHENCHKTIVKIRIQKKNKSQIVLVKVKLLQQTNVIKQNQAASMSCFKNEIVRAFIFSANDSPSKTIENAFSFI